jgi:hypothetical protein
MIALEHPNHDNLTDVPTGGGLFQPADYSYIGSYKEARSNPVTTKWTEYVVAAIHYPSETDFYVPAATATGSSLDQRLTICYPYCSEKMLTATYPYTGGCPFLLFIDSIPGNQFEWELIVHVEYSGRTVQSMATRSHSNITDLSTIVDARGESNAMNDNGVFSNTARNVENILKSSEHTVTQVTKTISNGARLANALFTTASAIGMFNPATRSRRMIMNGP